MSLGTRCTECGSDVAVWGCVSLCDRCLDARLWRELDRDDYVLVRRMPHGEIWVTDNIGRTRHSTNATYLNLDVRRELESRLAAFEAAAVSCAPPGEEETG